MSKRRKRSHFKNFVLKTYFFFVLLYLLWFISASNPKFILFPKQSASFVNVLGFLLEALFFWNLNNVNIHLRDASLAHTIMIWLTMVCGLLSFVEALSSTDRGSTVRFILCLSMCLQSSWIVHTGIGVMFKVSVQRKYKIIYKPRIWTSAVHKISSHHLVSFRNPGAWRRPSLSWLVMSLSLWSWGSSWVWSWTWLSWTTSQSGVNNVDI